MATHAYTGHRARSVRTWDEVFTLPNYRDGLHDDNNLSRLRERFWISRSMSTMEELQAQLIAEKNGRVVIEEKLQALMTRLDMKEPITRPERPPKFHGKENERADTWLFLNKQYFATMGMSANVTQCILLAASGFRDNAAIWWEHVIRQLEKKERPKMETWEMFETAVKAEFQPLDSQKTARDKLADLIQTRSVSAYVGIMRDLALQIPDLSQGDLLHKFTRGLKPMIRKEVELRDPSTLDEAVKMAERADVIEMSYRTNRRNGFYNGGYNGGFKGRTFNDSRVPPNRDNGPVPMELGAVQGSQGQRRERKPRDMSQIECYNCHKKGHYKFQCRNPPAPPNDSAKDRRQ